MNKIEFRNIELEQLLDYEQPTKYIVESEDYSNDFKTPVLTAGKSFLLGYTNETEGIYTKLPVIIFDDFTTANKFVDFKFKVKSSAMKLLTAKNGNIYLKYVFLMIQQLNFNARTHKRYYLSVFSKLKIPMPYKDNKLDLETQNKIVKKLELAEKLKENRSKADELTKEYLNAVFLDMFGDPRANPKEFEIKKLNKIAKINRESVIPEKILNGTNYIGLEHIEKESGNILNYEVVNEGELKSNKFLFDETMLLYGKLRPYLNKIALPSFSGVCSTDILPIKPIKNESNRIFLVYLLRQDYYIKLATTRSTGANLPRLSPSSLEEFEVITPPIELQNKFAEIVIQVEQLKEYQNKSKIEIDNLFNVLMQQAFRGEL